jgi:HJR/Mrr/RecB family endonuclease
MSCWFTVVAKIEGGIEVSARLIQRFLAIIVVSTQPAIALATPSEDAETEPVIRLEDFGKFNSKPLLVASGVDIKGLGTSNVSEVIEAAVNARVKQWNADGILQGTRTLNIQPEIVELRLGNHAFFRNSRFRLRLNMTDGTREEIVGQQEFNQGANGIASVFTKGRSDTRMYNEVIESAAAYLDSSYQAATARVLISRQEMIAKQIEAAERGDVSAQFALGLLYSEGKQTEQNDQEAAKWWQRAAELGYADAQLALGWTYAIGRGVIQDDRAAVTWLRKAAEQGNAEAQWRLASMLEVGRGAAINSSEAMKWWRKAAGQGVEVAKERVAQQERSTTKSSSFEDAQTIRQPQDGSGAQGVNPMLFITAGLLFVFLLPIYLNRRAGKTAGNKAAEIVNEHLSALVRRRAQLVTYDPYGAPRLEKWEGEINYFIQTQILPTLTSREQKQLRKYYSEIVALLTYKVQVEAGANPHSAPISLQDMSPIEYEGLCATELDKGGWKATLTKGSGDQGVDVIAERDGIRLILQCKLYSNPVGNKAVQEAAAGRAHENADYAAVVSNSSYTNAARQLAQTNKILLLHHSQLATLDPLDELMNQLGRE